MTKKDYISFAKALIRLYNEAKDEKEKATLEKVREEMITIFGNDNGRFQESKFNEYITKNTQ